MLRQAPLSIADNPWRRGNNETVFSAARLLKPTRPEQNYFNACSARLIILASRCAMEWFGSRAKVWVMSSLVRVLKLRL